MKNVRSLFVALLFSVAGVCQAVILEGDDIRTLPTHDLPVKVILFTGTLRSDTHDE